MLTPESALRKDRTTTAQLEHRHFAEIARIIRYMANRAAQEETALHFARELAGTNPRFDRARFLRACGVEP